MAATIAASKAARRARYVPGESVLDFAFIRRHPRRLALGFGLTFFASFGQTYFIAVFGGQLREAFALGVAGFGAVYSAATLASGLLILYLGGLIDRLALPLYVGSATIVLALAALMLASPLSASPLYLFAALLLLRLCGQGLLSHASATTMAREFTRDRGKALTFTALGHAGGEAVFPIGAVALMALVGWQGVWLAIAAGLLLLALPLFLWLAQRRHSPLGGPSAGQALAPSGNDTDWTRAEVLRDPVFYLLAPAVMTPPVLNTGIFFHQVPLVEAKGWPLSLFAGAFTVYALATVIAILYGGRQVDRIGAGGVLRFALVPLALGLVLLAVTDASWGAYAFMAFSGLSTGIFFTSSTAIWAETYGTSYLGAIRALSSSLMVFATAAAPALFGWLLEAGLGFDRLLGLCAGWTILVIPNIFIARTIIGRRKRRTVSKTSR